MISPTDVVNLALRRLSLSPIISMEENSDRSRAAAPVWPLVFNTVLTAWDWSFARKEDTPERLVIPEGATTPYANAFAMPSDCLKIRNVFMPTPTLKSGWIIPETPQAKYVVGKLSDTQGTAIYSDEDVIKVLYTSNAVVIDDFPPDAFDMLVFKMAAELALNLKNASQRAQEMIQRYQMAFEAAKKSDIPTISRRRLEGYEYNDARNL